MKDAVYQATCPAPGTFSETPQRHLAAEPFDARCCRGYWIKVPRSAEKIISQGRPALLLSRPPSSLSAFLASLGTLFPSVLRRERNLPSRPPSFSFGFPPLVVFLCRQNGRRRHLALNIYGKVPFATAKLRRPFSRFLVPAD